MLGKMGLGWGCLADGHYMPPLLFDCFYVHAHCPWSKSMEMNQEIEIRGSLSL